jgi:hypothetical protein
MILICWDNVYLLYKVRGIYLLWVLYALYLLQYTNITYTLQDIIFHEFMIISDNYTSLSLDTRIHINCYL